MNQTKYEKETIIQTSEGDSSYTVYTFDRKLKFYLLFNFLL